MVNAAIKTKSEEVACPWGHPCELEVPSQLPVAWPDARASILEGRLGRTRCPTCGRDFVLDQSLNYVDPLRGHCIRVQRRSEVGTFRQWEQIAPTIQDELVGKAGEAGLTSPPLFRLVFGLGQLREKLLLWEAGLDDRLVEIAKLENLAGPNFALARAGLFDLELVKIELSEWRLRFQANTMPPSGEGERVFLSLERYEACRALEAHYRTERPEIFEAPFVSALRVYLEPK